MAAVGVVDMGCIVVVGSGTGTEVTRGRVTAVGVVDMRGIVVVSRCQTRNGSASRGRRGVVGVCRGRGGRSSADGRTETEISEAVVVVQVGHVDKSRLFVCLYQEEAAETTRKREFSLYISTIGFARDRRHFAA